MVLLHIRSYTPFHHHLPYHSRFLGVFTMFITWVLATINLILALLNVSSLVISQLRKDIVVIVLFFAATLLAPMSRLLSLFPIFLLMRLPKRLPLSLMSCLFRYLFHISLSLSCCLHALLLLSGFIHIDHSHQLLHHHHHLSRLRIHCHSHLIPCQLPYRNVHVLALLNILLVSLYPLVLYLLPILALFPIFLLFPPQRQCKMPYLTLVGGKLWNWK
jgi:hypothetical protein